MNRSAIQLGVNIDHVATVRQARGTTYPDLLAAAQAAMAGGADAITVHLREDRRHIQDRDVHGLREMLAGRLNLEIAATAEMVDIARRVRPDVCCIVPERREELTTEGGLDVCTHGATLRAICTALRSAGIEVSLFVDPDPRQIDAAVDVGAPTIELHTGRYALASDGSTAELEALFDAAAHARARGLRVNAGHGLHYDNVAAIAAIEGLHELNIGHAIVARALFVGLERAVADMKQALDSTTR